jgi:hypothetical protein
MLTYYRYNPLNLEYIGLITAEMAIAPDDSTLTPPPDFSENQRPIYVNDSWSIVEDYRGRYVYSETGQAIKIEDLGPIPEGYSLTRVPTEAEVKAQQMVDLKRQLADLDAKYLTPRTLAGLALGDTYALSRQAQHETEAAPIRELIKELETA